jgi:DNA-binding PadR family transcriptional regulator
MSINRKRLPRTPGALAVLNLLVERSMHPYEIKSKTVERGHDRVVKLKGGSVYDAIERLTKEGLIRPVETSREGRRPERTVYEITGSGRELHKAWLEELLSVPVHEYPLFAAGLSWIVTIEDREQAIELLKTRIAAVEAEMAASDAITRPALELGVPRIFLIEEEYGQRMRAAEVDWVRWFVGELEQGRLWPDVEALKRASEIEARLSQGGER